MMNIMFVKLNIYFRQINIKFDKYGGLCYNSSIIANRGNLDGIIIQIG